MNLKKQRSSIFSPPATIRTSSRYRSARFGSSVAPSQPLSILRGTRPGPIETTIRIRTRPHKIEEIKDRPGMARKIRGTGEQV